jgi:hypothetical protein
MNTFGLALALCQPTCVENWEGITSLTPNESDKGDLQLVELRRNQLTVTGAEAGTSVGTTSPLPTA